MRPTAILYDLTRFSVDSANKTDDIDRINYERKLIGISISWNEMPGKLVCGGAGGGDNKTGGKQIGVGRFQFHEQSAYHLLRNVIF